MFRSIWTILRELTLSLAKVTLLCDDALHSVHTPQPETHVPQHCITYNDVSLLIISTKV